MVVAEIPLCVIDQNHSAAAVAAATSSVATTNVSHHGGDQHQAAQRSLSLLLPSSGGAPTTTTTTTSSKSTTNTTNTLPSASLRNAKKCAIYSVDVHPDGTKFATAGGDGTVRIWNALSLFALPTRHAPKFDATTGAYVSSSSSDGGSSSSSNSSSNNNGNSDHESRGGGKDQGHGNRAADDENDSSSSKSSSSSSSSPFAAQEVHDLNSVVRRKKGGVAVAVAPPIKQPTPLSLSAATTTTAAAAVEPPHHKNNNNHKSHQHHRLLCTLSAHTGSSVLCVRFSTTGKYLASAGDDACVCIYAPKKGPAVGNLTSDHQHQHHSLIADQHWTRILLCRGHGLDVVDLAWAPDDSHLVSCSLDSNAPICVWKMGIQKSNSMILHPFQILGANVHTSTVKGVTFDPAGSYLASSGDDPAVCIWRAHDDWGLEARIDASSGIFRQWKENDVTRQTKKKQSE